MAKVRTASCFCGAVEVSVEGDPVTQGFCHCASCRAWTAQPVTAYALWPAPLVRVTKGADVFGHAPRNDNLATGFCTKCGGAVLAESKLSGLTDVFPMIVHDFEFVPQSHINYAERAIDMRDGLPKFKDMPDVAGGTGEMMPE
jgi:hypothetical protein